MRATIILILTTTRKAVVSMMAKNCIGDEHCFLILLPNYTIFWVSFFGDLIQITFQTIGFE